MSYADYMEEARYEENARHDRYDGFDLEDHCGNQADQWDCDEDAVDEAFDDFLEDLACATSADYDDSVPF